MTTAPAGPQLHLPPLHPTQLEIAQDPARFKVVCCGRRWGKTMLGIVCCLRPALRGGRVWWVAPSYKEALEGWAYLLRLCTQMPRAYASVQVSELHVRFAGGGTIQVRTGDNPDNLRGAGLDGLVLDEAATMKPEVWDLVLRPALADKQGWAMFPSTPQHFNWFYDLYELGESGQEGWRSWHHPTWDNPYIAEAEIEAARRDMTPEDFDQEFGASFTAVGGAVFPLLSANRHWYLAPMPAGLDWLRRGVAGDWGTTPQHEAAVVGGGVIKSGAVWIHSNWLDHSGSSNLWREEMFREKRQHGATFARVDRSQSSELDRLRDLGFEAESGNPHVEVRISELAGLIHSRNIFWDSSNPRVVEGYNRLCAYHRDKEGKIVEEADDDVDATCYLVSELVKPHADMSQIARLPLFRR